MSACLKWKALGLALSAAVAGRAQTPASGPPPFLVGLQATYNAYEFYYRNPYVTPTVVRLSPWMLTAGYYVRPRLALQLGFGYGRTIYDTPGATGTTPSGQHVRECITYSVQHHVALPLQARYTLIRPSKRLGADVLLGAVLVYHSFTEDVRSETDGVETFHSYTADSNTQYYLTAGVSVRYAFSCHFEAVGDWSWNRNLQEVADYRRQLLTGSTLGLTRSTSVGLRYRFSLRKPAPKPVQ